MKNKNEEKFKEEIRNALLEARKPGFRYGVTATPQGDPAHFVSVPSSAVNVKSSLNSLAKIANDAREDIAKLREAEKTASELLRGQFDQLFDESDRLVTCFVETEQYRIRLGADTTPEIETVTEPNYEMVMEILMEIYPDIASTAKRLMKKHVLKRQISSTPARRGTLKIEPIDERVLYVADEIEMLDTQIETSLLRIEQNLQKLRSIFSS